MVIGILAAAVLLLTPAVSQAEWQVKPFAAVTFGGATTYNDPEQAVGTRNFAFGVSGLLLGEVFGVEADFAYAPGFYQSEESAFSGLVTGSSVSTWTGNLVVAWPRRLAEYTLRPYFVAGLGVIRSNIDHALPAELFDLADTLPAIDIGGGVTGFLSERIGVSWDVRRFRSIDREPGAVLTVLGADKHVSFWRANVALAIRY
jgi:hypothetical protein